jgi:hypothetical protein
MRPGSNGTSCEPGTASVDSAVVKDAGLDEARPRSMLAISKRGAASAGVSRVVLSLALPSSAL